jgi:hypothetical protein
LAGYAGSTWDRIEAEDALAYPSARHPGTVRLFAAVLLTPMARPVHR